MQKEIVKVGSHDIREIEWNGERVITTAQLAEVYETSVDNVRVNFNNNKDKFQAGKHYFLLEGDALREFKHCVNDTYAVKPSTRQLYLWTRRGASRHCKILDTEIAMAVRFIFQQAGIDIPEYVVKIPAYEQLSLDIFSR